MAVWLSYRFFILIIRDSAFVASWVSCCKCSGSFWKGFNQPEFASTKAILEVFRHAWSLELSTQSQLCRRKYGNSTPWSWSPNKCQVTRPVFPLNPWRAAPHSLVDSVRYKKHSSTGKFLRRKEWLDNGWTLFLQVFSTYSLITSTVLQKFPVSVQFQSSRHVKLMTQTKKHNNKYFNIFQTSPASLKNMMPRFHSALAPKLARASCFPMLNPPKC